MSYSSLGDQSGSDSPFYDRHLIIFDVIISMKLINSMKKSLIQLMIATFWGVLK